METSLIVSLALGLGMSASLLLLVAYLFHRLMLLRGRCGELAARAPGSAESGSEAPKLASLLADMTLQRDALLNDVDGLMQRLRLRESELGLRDAELHQLRDAGRELEAAGRAARADAEALLASCNELETSARLARADAERLHAYCGDLERQLHELRSGVLARALAVEQHAARLGVVAGEMKGLYDATRPETSNSQEPISNDN